MFTEVDVSLPSCSLLCFKSFSAQQCICWMEEPLPSEGDSPSRILYGFLAAPTHIWLIDTRISLEWTWGKPYLFGSLRSSPAAWWEGTCRAARTPTRNCRSRTQDASGTGLTLGEMSLSARRGRNQGEFSSGTLRLSGANFGQPVAKQ